MGLQPWTADGNQGSGGPSQAVGGMAMGPTLISEARPVTLRTSPIARFTSPVIRRPRMHSEPEAYLNTTMTREHERHHYRPQTRPS